MHSCRHLKGFKKELGLALGDRYRKFYRMLNNAKKNHSIQYSIQKFQKHSFKILFIQNLAKNIHPKNTFIQSLAHSKIIHFF